MTIARQTGIVCGMNDPVNLWPQTESRRQRVADRESMSVDSFKLKLPVRGTETKDWVVNYFVAHPKAGQFRDYRGGLNTYPKPGSDEHRHTGTDFCVPNFRWMDRGFAVYASASGNVIYVRDGETDRNTSRSCPGGFGNHVRIKHHNGFTTIYGHLKNGSISVERGQDVVAGEKIGVIGSSGSSDGPHLHFELWDVDGKVLDPCEKEYWSKPPMYDPPFSIMDFSVQKGPVGCLGEARMPPRDNVETFSFGELIGLGLFMSGLQANEEIVVRFQIGHLWVEGTLSVAKDQMGNFTIGYGSIEFPEYGRGMISIYRAGAFVREHGVEVQCPS